MEVIEALATQPRPKASKKLKGQTRPPVYRIRTGRYRTLYTIQDDQLIVLVIRVGARKDVYRGL
jgi:mRNA interferase RelE/StbE